MNEAADGLGELRLAIERARTRGLYVGELNYIGNETLKNVIEFYTKTKPSELFSTPGKGGAQYEIPEPQMRELWGKWVESAKNDLYGKAFQLPGLTLDEVLRLFKDGDSRAGGSVGAPPR